MLIYVFKNNALCVYGRLISSPPLSHYKRLAVAVAAAANLYLTSQVDHGENVTYSGSPTD